MVSKSVYKIDFNEYWRIGEHESWFEDMAAKGLHLENIGLFFVKFDKGEPKKTRYRVDVSSNEDITKEEKEMHAQRGWEYITSYRHFDVFSSPEELNAPEFYIDPVEQSHTLKKLNKELVFSALTSTLLIISYIIMFYFNWLHNYTPTLFLVGERSTYQPFALTIVIMFMSYKSIKAVIYMKNLRKNLEKGIHINHNVPWKKLKRLNYIGTVFYILVFVITFTGSFTSILGRYPKTLPTNSEDLPIVRLADIEKDQGLVRKESYYNGDNIDWGNWYEYSWSIFAPIKYESYEEGFISNKTWKDGSGVYSPSVNTRVYKLRDKSMSKSLISDLMKKYGVEYKDKMDVNHPYLDTLIVYESDDFKAIYASKGKGVIHVRYFGDADTDSIIESISDKIKLISN